MGVLQIIRSFRDHPLTKAAPLKATARFIKWQIHNKILPYSIIYPFVGTTKLIVKKGLRASTGNLYCGLQEFQEMSFLLHFLNKNDLFIDVGANIGTYTVLASGHSLAQTIAFEPIPVTFQHLSDNIAINHLNSSVTALNIGIGAKNTKLKFTSLWDVFNNVITDDNLTSENNFIEVDVKPLDEILIDKEPALMKIDVEGFESEVIKGANKTLAKQSLKAIIIELNGSGERYGYSDEEIHKTLIAFGFEKYIYLPFERKLQKPVDQKISDGIYVRDIDFVSNRLRHSPKINIIGNVY
jgi:FkbM family methyltransferase